METTQMPRTIPVIDLFAGPGGLSEGFARALSPSGEKCFDVRLSIEKDPVACSTLRLRSFYRRAERHPAALRDYYNYLRGEGGLHSLADLFARYPVLARVSEREVFEATLGITPHDAVSRRIREALGPAPVAAPWILIGGPPCQAYSLVGRARMLGMKGSWFYRDKRHTLYKE